MHKSVIAKVLGLLLLVQALIALAPLYAAWYSDEALSPWLIMCGSFVGAGLGLAFIGRKSSPERDLGIREGVAVTFFFWAVSSILAAIGICLAHPTCGFIHAWFEGMSGLTTTGSSIFGSSDPEDPFAISNLPNGILIWRALLQWMGGIGIIVISIALIPLLIGGSGFQMYRAEMPGLSADRLSPRLATTAQIILGLYIGFTIVVTVLLLLCGISPFHAICHSMTTVATGGFSSFDNSIEGMNSHTAEWIIIFAMIIGGLNFSLLLSAIRGKPLKIFRNTEAKVFLFMILFAWAVCACSLAWHSDVYDGKTHDLLRDSLFNVASMGTSTGYATGYDANHFGWSNWPSACIIVMVMLMICGGCAGSTAGGMKVIRVVLSFAAARREMRRFIEPARVTSMKIDGRQVNDRVILQVGAYVGIYAISLFIGTLGYALLGNNITVSFSAALTAISNMGPGLGDIGTHHHFRDLSEPSLLLSTFLMLLGRLELIGALMTIRPKHWR